jgi:hypothetical protein
MGKLLFWLSYVYVWWLLDGTEHEDDEPLHEKLYLARADGEKVARPWAKRIAGTLINRRYGRAILDSDDMFECFLTLANYALTTRSYLRRKLRRGVAPVIPGPWAGRKPDGEVRNGEHVHGEAPAGAGTQWGPFGSGRVPNPGPEPN